MNRLLLILIPLCFWNLTIFAQSSSGSSSSSDDDDNIILVPPNSNANVGIGTDTPAEKLTVDGDARVTGQFVVGTNSVVINGRGGNRPNHIYSSENSGNLLINSHIQSLSGRAPDNAANTILNANDNNGFVGIGTAMPLQKLHIQGIDNPTLRIENTAPGNPPISRIELQTLTGGTASIVKHNTGRLALGTGGPHDLQLRTFGGGSLTFSIGSAPGDVMKIIDNGNVGIGTTAPSTKLHVQGDPNPILFLESTAPAVMPNFTQIQFGRSDFAQRSAITRFNTGALTLNQDLQNTDIIIYPDGDVGLGRQDIALASPSPMNILADRNVGIGTNTPTNNLEIDAGIDNPNQSGLTFTQLTSTSVLVPDPGDYDPNRVLTVDATGEVILIDLSTLEASGKAGNHAQLAEELTQTQTELISLKAELVELKACLAELSDCYHAELNNTLNQNYPNPFSGHTTISYQLENRGRAILRVFDPMGLWVTTLVDKMQMEGNYSVDWDAGDLPGGVYIYTLEVDGEEQFRKAIHIK